MATNNNGNLLDSSGNVAVDFVWGNFPMQPNDDRNNSDWDTPVTTSVVAANASENNGWSGYSVYPAVRLNPGTTTKSFNNVGGTTLVGSNHAVAEAGYAGYPSFVGSGAKYRITAASSDGTTVTYTAQNSLKGGETVTITGLTTGAFNLSSVTVAYADALKFTVTDSATGAAVTGAVGYATDVTNAAAEDGAYVNGVAYIKVPSVLGVATATAQDTLRDAGYENANITTATAATNAKVQISRTDVTATTSANIYTSNAITTFPAGTKVEIFTGGASVPASLVGTWTVTGGTSSYITIAGSGWTVANTTGLTATVLAGKGATIKSQSTAGGAASVLTTATITITPWATAF